MKDKRLTRHRWVTTYMNTTPCAGRVGFARNPTRLGRLQEQLGELPLVIREVNGRMASFPCRRLMKVTAFGTTSDIVASRLMIGS